MAAAQPQRPDRAGARRGWASAAAVAVAVVAAVGLLALAGWVCRAAADRARGDARYAVPDPNLGLTLPRDLASHPHFRVERHWLATLAQDRDKRSYAVLFRCERLARAVWPALFRRGRAPAENHFAAQLLAVDLADGQFAVATRETDGAADAADATDIRLGDWRLWRDGLHLRLAGKDATLGVALKALPEKKTALFGRNGYHWRGRDGAPVYFLGQPRVAVDGALDWRGRTREVAGPGFWEYEFTSYGPPAGTQGLDRLTMALNNNHELTLVAPRRRDGAPCLDAPLSVVLPDGETLTLRGGDYEFKPVHFWTSRASHAVYPVAWTLHLEQYQADLNVTAYAAELEIAPPGGRPVWEGPCRVEGTWGGAPVRGFAFAELTGYARRPFKF